MPLSVSHEGPLCRPVIVCDHCGEIIRDAKDGNYMWKPNDHQEREVFRMSFTHKACCHVFEQQRGSGWFAEELAALPCFLLVNLNLTLAKSKAAANLAALN
jgi:hypothetical protein